MDNFYKLIGIERGDPEASAIEHSLLHGPRRQQRRRMRRNYRFVDEYIPSEYAYEYEAEYDYEGTRALSSLKSALWNIHLNISNPSNLCRRGSPLLSGTRCGNVRRRRYAVVWNGRDHLRRRDRTCRLRSDQSREGKDQCSRATSDSSSNGEARRWTERGWRRAKLTTHTECFVTSIKRKRVVNVLCVSNVRHMELLPQHDQ